MATLLGKTVMTILPTRTLRRAVVRAAPDKLRWRLALPCEEKYWESYVAQKGGPDYAADFADRMNPNLPLQPYIRNLIPPSESAVIRILDVGAGPLTVLGKIWPEEDSGRRLELTAVDPLANDYARILRRHHIAPPVPTRFCQAERLAAAFPENHFDLAYSRNALDHSYDPLAAIRQMLAVVRPYSVVLLEHLVDEGETEKYYGLHQWNFTLRNGRFIIWNNQHRIDVASEIGWDAALETRVQGRWLTVIIRKLLP